MAGCDFCIYIGQYNQRSKLLTNRILTFGYWEEILALDWAGSDLLIYIRQYIQRSKMLTKNILTSGYWVGTLVLHGARVIYVSISYNIINEVRILQIIYSPTFIVKGL